MERSGLWGVDTGGTGDEGRRWLVGFEEGAEARRGVAVAKAVGGGSGGGGEKVVNGFRRWFWVFF